ncbi:formimidoylglutamase [Cupriavidus taiwanensis]|uniref:Formimidoylglutamase n=1 Tax=Cupriavidus taiwanensis (strain DSM 17343 / BCRC 17206 / CCUG 44338 / CIP 107171 / LMG 19424 / R1) TaxID=977880 RepID=B2AFX8_CUPTR|nr:Formimidoylglutamase [Cupriavidus taiwanensis LMG 19424]
MRMAVTQNPWQGRVDHGEQGDTTRLFRIVQALDTADTAPLDHAPVLLGFRCDAGVLRNQGRPGAAHGPDAIRQALANVPAHGLQALYDAGNVSCDDGDLESAQQALADAVHAVLARGGFPLVLGGGHEVAWGTWQGLRAHLDAQHDDGRVLIVNIDAHFDLRTSRPASSGTPFDQIAHACAERGQPFDYVCLGVSRLANTPALFGRAEALGVCYVEDVDMQERHLAARLAELSARIDAADHVYLTIDLDALPGAVMPGVSAPAAYGVPLPVVEEVVGLVRRSGKLRVADLAEYNPQYDRDHLGARVAARLAWRLLR